MIHHSHITFYMFGHDTSKPVNLLYSFTLCHARALCCLISFAQWKLRTVLIFFLMLLSSANNVLDKKSNPCPCEGCKTPAFQITLSCWDLYQTAPALSPRIGELLNTRFTNRSQHFPRYVSVMKSGRVSLFHKRILLLV